MPDSILPVCPDFCLPEFLGYVVIVELGVSTFKLNPERSFTYDASSFDSRRSNLRIGGDTNLMIGVPCSTYLSDRSAFLSHG